MSKPQWSRGFPRRSLNAVVLYQEKYYLAYFDKTTKCWEVYGASWYEDAYDLGYIQDICAYEKLPWLEIPE